MKDHIKDYLSDNEWFLESGSFNAGLQGTRESQFTLGNGFIGSRGILEEMPRGAQPGTYIAGVYDKIGSKVSDLVNLPNPIHFKITVRGEKLDVSILDAYSHRRYLCMRKGLLLRHTNYESVNDEMIDYQSMRFFSMANKNIAVMRIFVTAVNRSCAISVQSLLDTAAANVSGISGGRKRRFRITDIITTDKKKTGYLSTVTLGSKISVSYAHAMSVKLGKRQWFADEEHIQLRLAKGQTAVFTKFYAIHRSDSMGPSEMRQKTIRSLERSIEQGFDALLKDHCGAWEKCWSLSDVRVTGWHGIQKSVRFNIYHLLISGVNDGGLSSIGAKTLSGEGYRGHVFWDSEIFIHPFFIYTNPDIARSQILYRARRLDKAREIAKARGYKGAMFPWESARTGDEETPEWSKNFDGSVIRIRTNEMEHHITADVAYSLYKYYQATEDDDLMKRCGFEMLLETARFWASRVQLNKRRKRYEVNGVIGPDEFHEGVNNNAYTNYIARWNIYTAYGMLAKMMKLCPETYTAVRNKIRLSDKEVRLWKDIMRYMHLPLRNDRVIEQFEGFFRLKRLNISHSRNIYIPMLPDRVKLKDIGKYMVVKQADVIMLLSIFPDCFTRLSKIRNFKYYAPITVHKSSLSPSIHSVVASWIGHRQAAYKYFLMSLRTDIEDIHGNAAYGIHAANLGGLWQSLIYGFAGMTITKGCISFSPNMPVAIKQLSFKVHWKGYLLEMLVKDKFVKMRAGRMKRIYAGNKGCVKKNQSDSVDVKIFGKIHSVRNRRSIMVKKGVCYGAKKGKKNKEEK